MMTGTGEDPAGADFADAAGRDAAPEADPARSPGSARPGPAAAEGPTGPPDAETGPIWAFRGLELGRAEFGNAMIHFYRAEVSRANTWRARLDATTNWAVITTGAALSFTFGSNAADRHVMIPISTLLVTLFLIIEARRYRYYELWSVRVRLMETNFFAAMLAPPHEPSSTWASSLADSLLHPQYPIRTWEAIGRRFRRNYQYIYLLLAIAWINKIALHPTPASSIEEFLNNGRVGAVPGGFVLATGILIYVVIFAIGWLSAGLRETRGEVLDSSTITGSIESIRSTLERGLHLPRRHEQLGHIITTRGEAMAEAIMQAFGRGVTGLPAKGMYTGEERTVLMVALDPMQARHLKETVYKVDPAAFVIIHGTEHVIGAGFEAPS